MEKFRIFNKTLLGMILLGMILCLPEINAAEEPQNKLEKSLKRNHEKYTGKTIQDEDIRPFKRLELIPKSLTILDLNENGDILETIACYLDLTSYLNLGSVNIFACQLLDRRWHGVYEHRFERPNSYVLRLLNTFPNLQLDLILNDGIIVDESRKMNIKRVSEAVDFVCDILQDDFANRLRTLYLRAGSEHRKKHLNIQEALKTLNIVNLRTLTLDGSMFESGPMVDFVETMMSRAFQAVQNLNLITSFLDKNKIDALIALIKKTRNLNNLSFNDNLFRCLDNTLCFNNYFFEQFPKALSSNLTLTTLNFQGCHFMLDQVPHLLTMMELANPTLTTLILDDNLFGLEGMTLILKKNNELSLNKDKSLKSLSMKDVSSARLLENGFVQNYFLEALKNESSLNSLTLGENIYLSLYTPYTFFSQVLETLSINRTLEKLCLFSFSFNESSINHLTQFFKSNLTLKRLELSDCFRDEILKNPPQDLFKKTFSHLFITAFSHNISIQELILDAKSRTFFGEIAMDWINKILLRNSLISMGRKDLIPVSNGESSFAQKEQQC